MPGGCRPPLCHDPASGSAVVCPDVRPEQAALSCDAAGCHGSYDYSPATPQASRDLDGDAGPSCHTCHGQEWSEQKTAGGAQNGDD